MNGAKNTKFGQYNEEFGITFLIPLVVSKETAALSLKAALSRWCCITSLFIWENE